MAERTVGGRYELLTRLGRGGMGEVWAARDRIIGRRVAVKVLRREADTPGTLDLFFREARTAGSLDHPGIVTVFDVGQDPDGTLYLVMALVDGRDLGVVLANDGPPGVDDAVEWAAQTADALAAAHGAGIVHRDLKPANLMLGPRGAITVLDFGIARFTDATGQSSQVIGTLAYMPPERFQESPGDARSDLYSLGCVLNELLTGNVPFRAVGPAATMAAHLTRQPTPPRTVRADVPQVLDGLVLQLLAKNPDDRPQSAMEVCARLRKIPPADGGAGGGSPGAGNIRAGSIRAGTIRAGTPSAAPGRDALPTTAPGALPTAARADVPSAAPDTVVAAYAQQTAAAPAPEAPPAPEPPQAPTRWSRRRALQVGAAAAVGTVAAGAGAWWATGSDPRNYVWRAQIGGSTRELTYDRDTVYLPAAHLYAVSSSTGKERWHHTDGSILNPPVVAGEVVVAMTGAGMVGLDRGTGARKWEQPADSPYQTMAAGDSYVVGARKDNGVDCRDASDGRLLWTRPAQSSPVQLAAGAGTVWIAVEFKAAEFDASSGTPRRQADTQVAPAGLAVDRDGPGPDSGTLYIGGYTAFNVWSQTPPVFADNTGSRIGTKPALGSGLLFIGGQDGRLHAFQRGGVVGRWVVDVGRGPVYTPDAWTSLVYATSEQGDELVAVQPDHGRVMWRRKLPGAARGGPVAGSDLVYVACADDHVYAFDARTGTGRD